MLNDNIQEIKEFEEKIRKETIQSIKKTIKIDDGFFSGKLVIQRAPITEDPFGENYIAHYELRLVPIDFVHKTMVSKGMEEYFSRDAKIIEGSFVSKREFFDKEQKEDLMIKMYDILSQEIAKELFINLGDNINIIINERKDYI